MPAPVSAATTQQSGRIHMTGWRKIEKRGVKSLEHVQIELETQSDTYRDVRREDQSLTETSGAIFGAEEDSGLFVFYVFAAHGFSNQTDVTSALIGGIFMKM